MEVLATAWRSQLSDGVLFMSDFKNTTRTVSGFHHWSGGAVGGMGGTGGTINRLARGGPVDKIDTNPGHPESYPSSGDRTHGNALTQRANPPTQELVEGGGKTPLISKFKQGGHFPAKHFHVHKHFHAKGGKTRSESRSYTAAEKRAEAFAEGGHIHDSTHIPPGGPDYAKGGKAKVHIKAKNRGALHRDMGVPQGQKIPKSKIQAKLARDKASGNTKGVKRDVFALNFRGKKPVHKNAGGALYAPGGPVSKSALGGVPLPGGAPMAGLARLAMRPQGLPMRGGPPIRRAMPMPGPAPLARAQGGPVHSDAAQDRPMMERIAKQAVGKHVRTAPPRGHGVK
jgi:hypothetical protein